MGSWIREVLVDKMELFYDGNTLYIGNLRIAKDNIITSDDVPGILIFGVSLDDIDYIELDKKNIVEQVIFWLHNRFNIRLEGLSTVEIDGKKYIDANSLNSLNNCNGFIVYKGGVKNMFLDLLGKVKSGVNYKWVYNPIIP